MPNQHTISFETTNRYKKFEEKLIKIRENIKYGKYEDAFGGDMRSAVTNLVTILLCDILGESQAIELLEGRIRYYYDKQQKYHVCNNVQQDKIHALQGSDAVLQLAYVTWNKLDDYFKENGAAYVAPDKEIESTDKAIRYFTAIYNDTSSDPHGNVSGQSPDNAAITSYRLVQSIFERLSGFPFLSSQTEEICQRFKLDAEEAESLKLPDYVVKDDGALKNKILENDLNIVREIMGDVVDNVTKGIVVLPPEILKQVEITSFLKVLNIPWSLIIDYNQNTNNGVYKSMPDEIRVLYPQAVEADDSGELEIAGGRYRHSWIFADGNFDDYTTIVSPNPKKRNSFITNAIKKTDKFSAADFAFFFIQNDFGKVKKLLNKLYNDSDFDDDFERRFSFYVLPIDDKNIDAWEKLKQETDFGDQINILSISVNDFINCSSQFNVVNLKKENGSLLYVNGVKIPISMGELSRYYESGLEFVDTSIERSKDDWDFYDGAEITWKEIQEGYAVQRKGHNIYLKELMRKIQDKHTVFKDSFFYHPGSGATTFIRQIAYDIWRYNNELPTFQCTVVFIKRFVPRYLLDNLASLSEKISNTPLLVVVESHVISEEPLNNLIESLKDAGKNIYFLHVIPKISNIVSMYLGHYIDRDHEMEAFINKFKKNGLTDEQLVELLKKNKITAIDFPLTSRESNNNVNFESKHFVKIIFNELPDVWKNVCCQIAYVYKYTGKSISLSIFKGLFEEKNTIDKWETSCQKAVKNLILDVDENGTRTNVWRPRYRVFADYILAEFFNSDGSDWETPTHLSSISEEFINTCASCCNDVYEDQEAILESLFTEKSDEDFRVDDFENEDGRNYDCGTKIYLHSFPTIIQKIADYDKISKLMNKLISVYPTNSYFLAHYSRFLYEYAANQDNANENDSAFDRAQNLMNKAVKYNDCSDKVYHMQGTMYNRIIRTFKNRLLGGKIDIDKVKVSENERNISEWLNVSLEAFEKSEYFAPLNTYGYMTEGQTIKLALEVIKHLKSDENYDFCNVEPWNDYVDRLNTIMLRLHELIHSVSQLYKNTDKTYDMFMQLRLYHIKVIGTSENDRKKYYENSISSYKSKEERVRYSQLYYWSTIYYAQISNNSQGENLDRTLSRFDENGCKKLRDVLNASIRDGNLSAFKQLHDLKIHGVGEYSIDEAIEHWTYCKEKCLSLKGEIGENTFPLMNAYYMLESYFSIKYILDGINGHKPDSNDIRNIRDYKSSAVELAHKNRKKVTILPYYFLGKSDDARALLSNSVDVSERRKVDCLIIDVDERKGKAHIVPCGLEATFGTSRGMGKQRKGDVFRMQIGFCYEGIGLYDEKERNVEGYEYVVKDSVECVDDHSVSKPSTSEEKIISTNVDTNDTTNEVEVCETGIIGIHNRVHLETPKVLGKIDVEKHSKSASWKRGKAEEKHTRVETAENNRLERGVLYRGVIIYNNGQKKVKCDSLKYSPFVIKNCDMDKINIKDNVIFYIDVEPNENGSGGVYYYATNVKKDDVK